MNKEGSLISDGLWVAISQIVAAAGTLAGVRILTEYLKPSEFGAISLWLGALPLITMVLANPTMQALLRFYPEYLRKGNSDLVRKIVYIQIKEIIFLFSPLIVILALVALWNGWANISSILLLFSVLAIDIIKTENTVVLSASRNQKAYGIWLAAESWLRPMLAVVFIKYYGAGVNSVLVGYFIATFILWLIMRNKLPVQNAVHLSEDLDYLKKQFWRYTLPLLPLGFFGWLSGMGDRYVIGSTLGLGDVGLYAAIYGLASRPVLMLGSIVETTIRPFYVNAVVSNDTELQKKWLIKWNSILITFSIFGLFISFNFHELLVKLFLGANYRDASYLMPWLLFGHIFLILSQPTSRVLYAHSKTHYLAAVEIIPVPFALLLCWVLTSNQGIIGAVIALNVGFMIQFFLSYVFACRFQKNK